MFSGGPDALEYPLQLPQDGLGTKGDSPDWNAGRWRRKRDFPVSEHAVVCTSSGKDPKLWSG